MYLRTRNEFVQKGEADDEDDDEDGQDNQGTVTEGVSVHAAAWVAWEVGVDLIFLDCWGKLLYW